MAVERASVTQDDTDFSSVVTSALGANADVVFIASQIANQITLLAVQLREQGYEGTYFTGDGGFDLSWVEPAGDAADGTYVSTFAPDPHDIPQMAEFVRRYTAAYGESFGPFAGASALATRIALEAVVPEVEPDVPSSAGAATGDHGSRPCQAENSASRTCGFAGSRFTPPW